MEPPETTPATRSRNPNPLPVAMGALAVSLIIALGADTLQTLLIRQAQSTFQVMPAYLFRASLPFIQAAIMLALAWLLLIRLEPNRTAAIIYLVIGCLFIGTYLTVLTGLYEPLRNTLIGRFRNMVVSWGTQSNIYRFSVLWILIGITSLIRRSRQDQPGSMENQNNHTV